MVALWSFIVAGLGHLKVVQAALAAGATSSPPSMPGPQIARDLANRISSGSQVALASDVTFSTDFTQRFSVSRPPSYIVAVKPRLVTDVRQIVQYARSNRIPILTTGGGHGYSWSLNGLSGGIDIDLSNFNTIQVNSAANTMTIGGSVQTQHVTSALQAAGKQLPVGACMCVGYAGFTLGGGLGSYSSLHGPASDSLLSAEIVTGTGDILTASSTKHPDLLYGLKGAGFNYGIVTSLTYRVYPATNGGQAVVTNMMFPGSLNGTIWQTLAKFFKPTQPKELGITLSVGYNQAAGGIVIIMGFVYAGPEAASTAVLKPFMDLNPLNLQILPTAWEDINRVLVYGAAFQTGCKRNNLLIPYSVNLYKVDVPKLISIINYMSDAATENPALAGVIITWAQYSTYGFSKSSDLASAFPYRDPTAFVQINAISPTPDQIPTLSDHAAKLRSRFLQASGRSRLEVYVNFAHGDEGPESWYSSRKLAILATLKRIYDPANIFCWYNPVRAPTP
ncbi:6-hydroxy-D-nicotine oxidase [Rhypophila decipiens]